MPNSKALVTLALGAVYQFRWQRYCRANWQAYADRHGYDLICLEAPLDTSPAARSATWQKCLILSQPFARQYERVVWLDADMLFHPDAPCLASQVPAEHIGAVDQFANPSPEAHRLVLARLYQAWDTLHVPYVRNLTPRAFYNHFGLLPKYDQVVQGGLLVLSPEHHREVLEAAYACVYPAGGDDLGEMPALSHAVLQSGCVQWLDPRFDSLIADFIALRAPELLTRPGDPAIHDLVGQALDEAYCLHLAGMGHYVAAGRARLDQIEAARAPAPRRPAWAPRVDETPALQTPVALFVFNRPETTARVFDTIRAARPTRLLLIADGPRSYHPDDAEQCAAARAVAAEVDWECEVLTHFASENLGPKERIESGLDWVFEQVARAIILEDDCLAGADFFRFCDELLNRYADDERVLTVSGNSVLTRADPGRSYFFSRYSLTWGWATWRRAWQARQPLEESWPPIRDSGWLAGFLGDETAASYWAYLFDKALELKDSWDYAWALSSWRRNGLSALPVANLVSNIGYGPGATHTQQPDAFANMPIELLGFPLRHPDAVACDTAADELIEAVRYSGHLRRLFASARRRLRAGEGQ